MTIETFDHLIPLGWNDFFALQFESLREAALIPARVAIAHSERYELIGADQPVAALSGRLRRAIDDDLMLRPTVGDWVGLAAGGAADGATQPIQHVFARKSQFVRKAAGREVRPQVIAANIDTIFIVVAADQPLNPRRIERYLAATWGGGADPVLVLSKSDLVSATAAEIEAESQASLGPVAHEVPIVSVSAQTQSNLKRLSMYIEAGQTVAFVGISGVGKSTLVNALIGRAQQRTYAVRAGDGKGRHTTSHRELFVLERGGLFIDTPGMREFGLWAASDGLTETFHEISSLAEQCRFRDCRHQGEPGCAVRFEVNADRLQSYRKLQRENAYEAHRREQRGRRDDTKKRWKGITKVMRERRKHEDKQY